MPFAWTTVEKDVGENGKFLEVYDEMPATMAVVRECLKPIISAETFRSDSRWRTIIVAWCRMKMLQKMRDRNFLREVYGESQAEMFSTNASDEHFRKIADGFAIALTEALLDEVLRVK
jgi:hypothetical protein